MTPREELRTNKKMHRMLRVSGTMLIIGLLIEAVSLHYNKALSFLAFMFIGGALLIFGAVLYLLSLLLAGPPEPDAARTPRL